MSDFSDSVALVTGASRGLGFAMARALGARGAHVIALARTTGGLEELDDALKSAGGAPATLVPADVTDDDGMARLGAAIHDRWGRLDIWVHCAAHAPPLSPAEHMPIKELHRALAVNARATGVLIRMLDPLLRVAPDGCALFMDDLRNLGRFHGAYQASKAAAKTLTAAWADERGTRGPRILHAAPPAMATALRGRFRPGEDRAALADPNAVARDVVAEYLDR